MKIKFILPVFLLVLFLVKAQAQCPESFNYQTVVRDINGNPIANTIVAMRFTVKDSTNPGVPLYQEILTQHTNTYGLTVLQIGTGQVVTGNFATIDWSKTDKYMTVEDDINTTGTFVNVGTEKLASVPYALYADSALKGGYPKHHIGEAYGGGVVYYVTDNGQHGLIADSVDLQTGNGSEPWGGIINLTTNATLQGTGGGSSNTERIIISQDTGSYAAQLCANFNGGGYGDWFLPSANELSLLYQQQQIVSNFSATSSYWSSTETSASNATAINFANGTSASDAKSTLCNIRAVRTF